MYLLIENGHSILIQYYGELYKGEQFNYVLHIEIFRNSSLKILGVLIGDFFRFWVYKWDPDALLAKNMRLRLRTLWVTSEYQELVAGKWSGCEEQGWCPMPKLAP